MRALVREVQAPSLIAVQSEIARSEAFRALAPEFRIVELEPFDTLAARDALRQILEHRLRRNDFEFALTEVVGDDGLEVLVAFYAETAGSIRHALAAVQTAADHAVNASSERIHAPHVEAAVQEWRLRVNG